MSDRLTNCDVIERLDRLVEPDVADVECGPVQKLKLVVVLDGRVVLWVDEVETLDLAGLQSLETGRWIGDRLEDQRLDVARRVAPVVRVASHDETVTALPFLEHEWSGAGRVLGCVGAGRREDALCVDLALVGLELLERSGAGDCEARQGERSKSRGRGLREVQRDDELLCGLAALVQRVGLAVAETAEHGLPVVAGRRVLEGALEVVPTVEVEADGLGVELLAVVEGDALLEVERVREPVLGDLPVRGETGNDLSATRLECYESLEDLVDRPAAIHHRTPKLRRARPDRPRCRKP